MMRAILVAPVLMVLMAEVAFTDECACKLHSAKAVGSGSCSRTEDPTLCTITFTSASSKLPADVMSDAGTSPPERWRQKTEAYLPDLLALSQPEEKRSQTKQLFEKLDPDAYKQLLSSFRSPNRSTTHKVVGNTSATFAASYGCIEFQIGGSTTTFVAPGAKQTDTCVPPKTDMEAKQ